ncbi:hypothetical protein EDD11_005737 [Mortierella claussenii]|nr:hypothetical protein EDD11_005737 [Mortierella claussenii]
MKFFTSVSACVMLVLATSMAVEASTSPALPITEMTEGGNGGNVLERRDFWGQRDDRCIERCERKYRPEKHCGHKHSNSHCFEKHLRKLGKCLNRCEENEWAPFS